MSLYTFVNGEKKYIIEPKGFTIDPSIYMLCMPDNTGIGGMSTKVSAFSLSTNRVTNINLEYPIWMFTSHGRYNDSFYYDPKLGLMVLIGKSGQPNVSINDLAIYIIDCRDNRVIYNKYISNIGVTSGPDFSIDKHCLVFTAHDTGVDTENYLYVLDIQSKSFTKVLLRDIYDYSIAEMGYDFNTTDSFFDIYSLSYVRTTRTYYLHSGSYQKDTTSAKLNLYGEPMVATGNAGSYTSSDDPNYQICFCLQTYSGTGTAAYRSNTYHLFGKAGHKTGPLADTPHIYSRGYGYLRDSGYYMFTGPTQTVQASIGANMINMSTTNRADVTFAHGFGSTGAAAHGITFGLKEKKKPDSNIIDFFIYANHVAGSTHNTMGACNSNNNHVIFNIGENFYSEGDMECSCSDTESIYIPLRLSSSSVPSNIKKVTWHKNASTPTITNIPIPSGTYVDKYNRLGMSYNI